MSAPSVLIAAFSGRALAQSARRAGYQPIVVDCFGDADLLDAAASVRCLQARVQVGFQGRRLIAALEQLAASATSVPIGLVLGAGFECNPRLVSALAERFELLGNSADTIRRVKDPSLFFAALERLGIRYPETRLDPPGDHEGWLMKRIGGSGGLHIHRCPPVVTADKRRYFQRRLDGAPVSVLGIASPSGTAFAVTRQWVNPLGKRPYRYGGAAGPLTLEADLEVRLIEASLAVEQEFGLRGLVSFDFLIADGEPVLIEVNPRPGASLDVLDDACGSLFSAHIEACRGGNPADLLQAEWHPPEAAAAAYLYADRADLTVPDVVWPDWTADRPIAGSVVQKRQPLATVMTRAGNVDDAERLCRKRLETLETMLYVDPARNGAHL